MVPEQLVQRNEGGSGYLENIWNSCGQKDNPGQVLKGLIRYGEEFA